MKRIKRGWLASILCCALICSCIPGIVAKAAANRSPNTCETVRVGWYQSAMFQEGMSDDETKSGYCYDYLQKVADYTSWKCEYVYGNWEDLFHKLEAGEIDFLVGVSITDERKESMLFPEYAMGTDQYYLFKRSDDSTISTEELSSLNGKTLGGIGNNIMTVLAEKWIRDNNLNVEIVYFKDFEDQADALKSGEVDLIVQTINNVLNISNIDVISKVGEEPFYLAVSKKKPELLTELNYSLGKMISIDPFILQNLQYKNYGANLINRTLSDDEKEWVNTHKTVVVGYLDNYLPYSATDEDGNATGIMTDVFMAIVNSLGLEGSLVPEYKGFESYSEMLDALRRDEICVAFPVYGNLWDLEKDGINASSEVVMSSEALFYKGQYKRDNIRKLAINRNNNLQQAYCRRVFPEAEILYGSSIEECLDMVTAGKADGTLVNSMRTEIVTRNSKYTSLSYIQMEIDDSRCFGVKEGNIELLTVLNRGLRVIGTTYGIDCSYKYIESLYHYSLQDFIRDNIIWIVLIFGTAVLVVIMMLLMSLKRKAREVKQKEESIRKAKELNRRIELLKDNADRANAAKTLFLNNMSHDIRTPMNAIIGYTEIAQKQTTSPEIRKYLDKIHDSSDHLLSLINDVLDISRIESGTVKIAADATDISHVTDEALNIVQGFLAGRSLQFDFEKAVNASPYVLTDALRIREILVNLLGNAVKFTDDGGKIRFVYELNAGQEGYVNVRYTVSDTGKGMSEEFQQHIFEEFAQENNGARTQYKGTGLGLTITKRYIDMMGGTISFESRKGEGSTFVVELTMTSANPALTTNTEELSPTQDVRGLRVLLAEDNDLNAEITQIQLDEKGIVVTRANNGSEAIEIFRSNPADSFDIILMDIMMPDMNGYEATKAIRAMENRPDGAKIPIIAMTANAFSEDVQKSFEAGMTAHLTKPIKADELIKLVSQTVGRRLRNDI